MKLLAVALDGQTSSISDDHQVNTIGTDLILWKDVVSVLHQAPQDNSLENLRTRIDLRQTLLHFAFPGLRVERMFDKSPAIVASLQIGFMVQTVNNPHLISCTTCSNIEPFFKNFLWPFLAHGKRWLVWRRVHYR